MKLKTPPSSTAAFAIVQALGLELPEVEATTKYDGSPVLKLGGCFMAGLATHPSAEAGTLVVRLGIEDRAALLEDAPETYYVTDYYRPYPIVLARLAHLDAAALRDLLSVSWRLTATKSRTRARGRRLAKAPDGSSRT
jgi:hypothetical protein